MPANLDDETVTEILARKKGTIRQAPLDAGSPSWGEILSETWADIKDKARRRVPGYKTFRKLLSDSEYDK
jgi:hypothetical protein